MSQAITRECGSPVCVATESRLRARIAAFRNAMYEIIANGECDHHGHMVGCPGCIASFALEADDKETAR